MLHSFVSHSIQKCKEKTNYEINNGANKVSLTYGHRFARNVTRLSPNAVQTFAFAEFGCTITVTNFIAAGSSTWIRHLRSVTKPSNHGSLF